MEGSADAGEVKTRRWRKCGLGCLVALVIGAGAATAGYAHLQRVYEAERQCPPVSGVVVDGDTGLPVAGAFVSRQMMGTSRSPLSGVAGGSPAEPLLRFAQQTTDGQGRFSFPADKTVLVGGFWEHLLGPDTREGIRLVVYAHDYLPARSEALGFGWTKEEWKGIDWSKGPNAWRVVGPLDFSATRQGSLETGYTYRIALIKAVTEAQWEEKCHETWLLNSLYIPKSISDEWLFNDLTGYLERWPQGEKAGEYVVALVDLAIAHGVTLTENSRLATLPTGILEQAVEEQKEVLKMMDRTPLAALSYNPVKQSNWPGDRTMISRFLSMMEGELARRKGR